MGVFLMSDIKKVEDRLLEKETERLNTIKDSLNLGEKHPEEEKLKLIPVIRYMTNFWKKKLNV